MASTFPSQTPNKSFWEIILYRRSVVTRNIRCETVFSNSEFLVGVKTPFPAIRERSNSAVDMMCLLRQVEALDHFDF
jgi:hypothetical protein